MPRPRNTNLLSVERDAARGRAAVLYRESRARAQRRENDGERPELCKECGAEVDVATPAHDVRCSLTVLGQEPGPDADRRADGSYKSEVVERRYQERVRLVVGCDVEGCDWKGFDGPMVQALEAGKKHRQEAHPRLRSAKDRSMAARAAQDRQREALLAMDRGDRVEQEPEEVSALGEPGSGGAEGSVGQSADAVVITGAIGEPGQEVGLADPGSPTAPEPAVRAEPGRRGPPVTYTRGLLVEELRRWAAEHGGHGPRQQDFRSHRPNSETVIKNFGSWPAALEAANLVERPKRKGEGRERTWPRDLILQTILDANEELGRPPTATEWKKASDKHPSERLVRMQFGSFNAGIEAAGLVARPRGVTLASHLDQPSPPPRLTGGRAVAFMYVLLRDHLPAGVVNEIVKGFEESDADTFVFSDPFLAAKAIELQARIAGAKPGYAADAARAALASVEGQPTGGLSC